MIRIIETLGRTEHGNGVSRPYRCLGEDGRLYFVKTAAMGVDQMIKEWVGCGLAAELSLPVAEPTFVYVPAALSRGEPDLSEGISFGSRAVENSRHCTSHLLPRCDRDVAARILLFDRWTRNNDRSFSPLGGNPNLLFVPATSSLVMIDHDNAFDSEFDVQQFWSGHGLRDYRDAFQASIRHEVLTWLSKGLDAVPELWDQLPREWLMRDDEAFSTTLALDSIRGMLSSFIRDPDAFFATP